MKHIDFYLDFVSPYAYLAFEKLPSALLGLSYGVAYRPVLFAGMLKHHGQLGPAEIPGKRDWTYRQVLWLARQGGIGMRMPAAHPFNPLGLLRLALACGVERKPGEAAAVEALPNRHVCEAVFRHVWQGGADAADAQRLAELTQRLAPSREPGGEQVKAQLKSDTEAAIARGIFGVPMFAVDDRLFWGVDSLPMLRAYLEGDEWVAGEGWKAAASVASGIQRAR